MSHANLITLDQLLSNEVLEEESIKLIIIPDHLELINIACQVATDSPAGVSRKVIKINDPDFAGLVEQVPELNTLDLANTLAFSLSTINKPGQTIKPEDAIGFLFIEQIFMSASLPNIN